MIDKFANTWSMASDDFDESFPYSPFDECFPYETYYPDDDDDYDDEEEVDCSYIAIGHIDDVCIESDVVFEDVKTIKSCKKNIKPLLKDFAKVSDKKLTLKNAKKIKSILDELTLLYQAVIDLKTECKSDGDGSERLSNSDDLSEKISVLRLARSKIQAEAGITTMSTMGFLAQPDARVTKLNQMIDALEERLRHSEFDSLLNANSDELSDLLVIMTDIDKM